MVLNQVWQNGIGLFAGAGIILIGRAASGILGIERLTDRCTCPGCSGRRAGR